MGRKRLEGVVVVNLMSEVADGNPVDQGEVDRRARMAEEVVGGGKGDRMDDEPNPAEGTGEVMVVDTAQKYRLRAFVHAGMVHRAVPC